VDGVHYEGGSLLGMVRMRGLTPWDHDGDACVPTHGKDRLLSAMCTNHSSSELIDGGDNTFPVNAAFVTRAAARVNLTLSKNSRVEVGCRPHFASFPLRIYLNGARLDVFSGGDWSDHCDSADPAELTLWPFYDRLLPGRADAKALFKQWYGNSWSFAFVCSDGMSGLAHRVAPPIIITDFRPALLGPPP